MTNGDKVVCISNNFPHIKEYGGEKGASIKPRVGDILIVDEVLGDFLRFDLFDTEESFNWWHKSRFRKIDNIEQVLTDSNCEPIEVQHGVFDIAPEREEITDQEELNQPWPQLKLKM